jgi:hypothetical protein
MTTMTPILGGDEHVTGGEEGERGGHARNRSRRRGGPSGRHSRMSSSQSLTKFMMYSIYPKIYVV